MFSKFQGVEITDWDEENVKKLFNYLNTIFSSEFSATRSVMTFSLMLCTFKSDLTWLDEIAETLKATATALSNYITFSYNLPLKIREILGVKHDLLSFFTEALRHICYTIGITTYRLIHCGNDSQSEELS